MFVAENSGIRPSDLESLFYNGFDNPESFQLAKTDELRALGLSEDAADLFDKIQATMEVYREYVATNGPYQSSAPGYGGSSQQIDEAEQADEVDPLPPAKISEHAKPITRMLMLGAVGKKPAVHHNVYLREKTHMHMAGK